MNSDPLIKKNSNKLLRFAIDFVAGNFRLHAVIGLVGCANCPCWAVRPSDLESSEIS